MCIGVILHILINTSVIITLIFLLIKIEVLYMVAARGTLSKIARNGSAALLSTMVMALVVEQYLASVEYS